jgi:hypothetical protein
LCGFFIFSNYYNSFQSGLPSHRVSVALANIPGFSSNILFGISVMQFDQDYYPGRRKRGKDYREDMVCPFALEFNR